MSVLVFPVLSVTVSFHWTVFSVSFLLFGKKRMGELNEVDSILNFFSPVLILKLVSSHRVELCFVQRVQWSQCHINFLNLNYKSSSALAIFQTITWYHIYIIHVHVQRLAYPFGFSAEYAKWNFFCFCNSSSLLLPTMGSTLSAQCPRWLIAMGQ